MTPSEAHAFAVSIFEAQPFTAFLGAELVATEAGGATIRLPIADHHRQQHGFVHGGVLSYLADNAITFAGGLALGGDALTAEFKINYVRPAAGEAVLAVATAVSVGRRQAVCRCDLHVGSDGERTLCALAQGTIVRAKG